MQAMLLSVGIDTLKVNPKFVGDDSKPYGGFWRESWHYSSMVLRSGHH